MRADAGLNILVVDHRLLSRVVYPRAVFARMSYSPVGIVMGVNWVSHFRYLVGD